LAHEPEGKVSARYRHSDLFERRIGLMELWGQYCMKPPAPVVCLTGVLKKEAS
jgi:hypothetical protein